jgi:hypothetical protein
VAILSLELRCDRRAQGRNAQHGRIFGFAALDCGNSGLLDVIGRVEVRLADRQRNDVRPWSFRSRAFCVIVMMAEGCTRESAWAMKAMESQILSSEKICSAAPY